MWDVYPVYNTLFLENIEFLNWLNAVQLSTLIPGHLSVFDYELQLELLYEFFWSQLDHYLLVGCSPSLINLNCLLKLPSGYLPTILNFKIVSCGVDECDVIPF